MSSFTRRDLLGLIGLPAVELLARQDGQDLRQGPASRHVQATQRGKASGLPFHAHFTDVASHAGLHHITVAGHSDRIDYVVEAMSCGAAFLDYDNDGWLDILVLSGSRFGDPPSDASNRLYKNNRNGTFTEVTEAAGLFRAGYWFGVTIGDYNNDGFEDIFVTGWPQNVLFRNNGNGTFTDVTKEAGLVTPEARFGSGCSFVESQRNGKLDLFVSNYVTFESKSIPRTGDLFLGPRGLPYGRHSFYKNNGDGTFTDVSAASGISKAQGGYGLTVVAADFDDSGWQDIYVACDSTPSLFFRNNRDGTFVEEAFERSLALSEDGMEQAGMGVALGDTRSLGILDVVKTHYAADTVGLYVNNGKAEFRDEVVRSGLAVEVRFVSWGVGIEDFDNDGSPDIFWVTGGIYPELASNPNEPFLGPRILFRNLNNGRFEELSGVAGPAVGALHCSRGCAFGDFDNDGDVDILIVNQNEPPSLLRNDVTGSSQWLKILCKGVHSNRSAIGTRVTVRYGATKQTRAVLSQSSYLSVNDRRLHFGLGDAKFVDIDIRWPAGSVETLHNVAAGRLIEVTEGAGITASHTFAGFRA